MDREILIAMNPLPSGDASQTNNDVTLPDTIPVRLNGEVDPSSSWMDGMKVAEELRNQLRTKYGIFPDCTELIAEDRCRDFSCHR